MSTNPGQDGSDTEPGYLATTPSRVVLAAGSWTHGRTRRPASQRGVGSALIVRFDPRLERAEPRLVGPVEPGVSPLVVEGPLEPLDLAVRLRPERAGDDVPGSNASKTARKSRSRNPWHAEKVASH